MMKSMLVSKKISPFKKNLADSASKITVNSSRNNCCSANKTNFRSISSKRSKKSIKSKKRKSESESKIRIE